MQTCGKMAIEFHTKKCDLRFAIFQISGKIDLLKIDVDDRESYEAVFAGVIPILHKVEILQIEMLEEEIGRNGVMWIADTFLVARLHDPRISFVRHKRLFRVTEVRRLDLEQEFSSSGCLALKMSRPSRAFSTIVLDEPVKKTIYLPLCTWTKWQMGKFRMNTAKMVQARCVSWFEVMIRIDASYM